MTTSTFVAGLAFRGVRFSAGPAGRLVVDAPAGAISPEELATLRERKAEIVGMLGEDPGPDLSPIGDTFSPIGETGPVPAWVDDRSLTVTWAACRASIDFDRRLRSAGGT